MSSSTNYLIQLYGGPADGRYLKLAFDTGIASLRLTPPGGQTEVYTYSPYVSAHFDRPVFIHTTVAHDFLCK